MVYVSSFATINFIAACYASCAPGSICASEFEKSRTLGRAAENLFLPGNTKEAFLCFELLRNSFGLIVKYLPIIKSHGQGSSLPDKLLEVFDSCQTNFYAHESGP